MPTHTHRTTAGDVDYTLSRRKHGGNWHYVFWWKGVRYRESCGTTDHAAAKAIAERTILNAQRETSCAVPTAAATLEKALWIFLDGRWPQRETRHRDRHYQDCLNRLDQFRHFAGDKLAFTSLSIDDARRLIQQYIDHRRGQGKAPGTLHNDQKVLSAFCGWMMKRHATRWTANPADKKALDLPRQHVTPKPAALQDDVEMLLENAKNQSVYAVLVLMCSGLRPVGVTRLRWTDIHLGEKPTVRVVEKSVTRIVPLSEWAREKLAAYKLRRPPADQEAKVFPFSSNYAGARIRALRGSSTITLYALRRMAYTRLYQAGVSPQLAAKIMGNSVRVALRHYVDLEAMNAHEAVKALDFEKPPQKPPHDTLTDPDNKNAPREAIS